MHFIHLALRRLGWWGIVSSYLLTLIATALLYAGVIGGDIEESERSLIAILLFVVATYFFARNLYGKGKLDDSLFYAYPITSLSEVQDSVTQLGAARYFIGNASRMKSSREWSTLLNQYRYAVMIETAFHPSLSTESRESRGFGWDLILGVKYTNGLVQFVQITPGSNGLFETMQFLKPFAAAGTPVDGDFEKYLNAKEQFTRRSWIKMCLLIFVIIVPFIFISVWFAGA